MEHLSYSQIANFKKCPFGYAAGRIKKALPSVATGNGQNKHAIIEEYLRNGRQGELPQGFGPRLGAFLKYTLPEVSGLETHFDVDIFGYKFKGVIDAHMLDGDRAVIVDWKNHKSAYVDPEQLKLYALAIANANPDINYFDCYFYYLIPDFKEGFEFTRAEIENFSGELLDIAGAMEAAEEALEAYKKTLTAEQLKTMTDIDILIASEAYKCKPGPNCRLCDHVESCPENRKFDIPVISSITQATELSKKLFAFEAFADTVKDRIKAYMLENSIDELQIDEENRYYIGYSAPSLKSGKSKTDKPAKKKKAEEKPVDITAEVVTGENAVIDIFKKSGSMKEVIEAAAGGVVTGGVVIAESPKEETFKEKIERVKREVAEEAGIKICSPISITVDDDGKITDSNAPQLIGKQLDPEVIANIPDGTIIPENPDPMNVTGQLFDQAEKPAEKKPRQKRETTAERIARLAAAADAAEKARNEKK